MKSVTMLLTCLLVTTAFAGCLFGDEDSESGCTDSGAVNYESSADDDDGSCVMPATQSELESAALTQLAALETSRANGEAYGIQTITISNVQDSEDDNVLTEITSIEILDPGNDAMRYTYHMEMNGMEMIDYEVKQKGDVINVNSEGEWYVVNDEVPNYAELLDAVITQVDEGDSESDAEYTCDNGATIPISWVNNGIDDCFDGTDEGVSQEDIDAAIEAAEEEDSGFLNAEEFSEMNWDLVVENGYQSLVSDDDENGTIYINFDGNVQLVGFTVEVIDTDTDELGMEFEDNVVTVTFLDADQLNIEVSGSHAPAASPFKVETDYDFNLYTWDCDLVVHLAPGVNRTSQSLVDEINAANDPNMPDWCNDILSPYELDDLIDVNNSGDTSHWSNGFAIIEDWGTGVDSWKINGNYWVDFLIDVHDYARFVCDDGSNISINWVNDGDDDCSDGSDEGISEQDAFNQTIVNCVGGSGYSEITGTCDLNMTMDSFAINQNYLHINLADDVYWYQTSWDLIHTSHNHWFAHESAYAATGNQNLSFVGTLTESYADNSDGMVPYAYIIEDEMNFQNSLSEFRLDLGYESMNDAGETQFNNRISFDLSQMQSGSDQDTGGYDWAFVYTDVNENGYLDAGDSFVIYTNAEGANQWDEPTVKLYHNWGQGYTDESPVLMPGFTFFSTICLLGIAALNRRKD